jgi:hypothetical protein
VDINHGVVCDDVLSFVHAVWTWNWGEGLIGGRINRSQGRDNRSKVMKRWKFQGKLWLKEAINTSQVW